jgi:hypothetical protein
VRNLGCAERHSAGEEYCVGMMAMMMMMMMMMMM